MAEPGICDFYAFLLQRLAPEKGARVIFARRDDTDVGFIFGGLAGDIYRGQQFSYAQDCHELSLGKLRAEAGEKSAGSGERWHYGYGP